MGATSNSGRPAYATATTVRFAGSDDALVCLVAASDAKRLVLTAPVSLGATNTRPGIGHGAEVSWSDAEGVLRLPAELLAVQRASVPLWHFRAMGPAARVQRRHAVRLPLSLPLQVSYGSRILIGSTSDLSEGGIRCTVTADGPIFPIPGEIVDVALFLDGEHNPLRPQASIVRVRQHDLQQCTLVLKFQALSDRDQDQIRARVFEEQRSLRACDLD